MNKEEKVHEELRQLPLKEVLESLGFSNWKSRKDGAEWFGQCPINPPKRNSTSFSFDSEGRYHCFSCGKKGRGAIDLAMAVLQVGFQDAVKILQDFKPMQTASKSMQQLDTSPGNRQESAPSCTPVENPPYNGKYEKFFKPHPWLEERGLLPTTLKLYEVGYYENISRNSAYNRSVMLKIRRWRDGKAVGYLSRNIGDITPERPKYRFPAGLAKGLELFGAWQLKVQRQELGLGIMPKAFIVESPFAVMAFHQKGFPAVSPFGFSLSDEQITILSQIARGFVYLPDRNKYDDIGESVRKLAQHCWVKTPELPEPINDPEHLSVDQIKALLQ